MSPKLHFLQPLIHKPYAKCLLKVKDVVFQEDTLPLKHHNAASNWSIVRNIVINIARQHGYNSLTKAERFFSHNIPQLFSLFQ